MSLKGKRFKIKGVRLFNVTELDGACVLSVQQTGAGVNGPMATSGWVLMPPWKENVIKLAESCSIAGCTVRSDCSCSYFHSHCKIGSRRRM